MKKMLVLLLALVLILACFTACNQSAGEGEKEGGDDTGEFYGCATSTIPEDHIDYDYDYKCDVCSYSFEKPGYSLVMGTYYLPYELVWAPTSITFFENGRCTIDFSKEGKDSYHQNYWVEGDKVYLDVDTAPKVHVFTILENALVFDPQLSTANLWDTWASLGPVVYVLPDTPEEEILGTVVMAGKGFGRIPAIERIYAKYDFSDGTHTNDLYAFMIVGGAMGSAWSDKILGTEYTFTYSDGREILIYVQGMLLTLNQAFDRGYITVEMLGELNQMHHDCKIAHSYDEGIVAPVNGGGEEILYTCRFCHSTKSVPLPEDFSFTLTYGFDLYYDSGTGCLKNGFNSDLNTRCETTLILDHAELMNIYRILYNGNFLKIKNDIKVSDRLSMPSYEIEFSYVVNGETVDFTVSGASLITYSEWSVYPEFCYAYEKVVNDFIKGSEEFKAMPPNQNTYE